ELNSGRPLPGVTVYIGSDCGGDGCLFGDTIVTDVDGRYSATDVHAGLVFVGAGYKPGEANYAPFPGEFLALADDTVNTLDIVLAPGVTVQGTVLGQADGQPVPNVYIELDSVANGYVAVIASDAAGKFTFTQLPADSYTLHTAIGGTM